MSIQQRRTFSVARIALLPMFFAALMTVAIPAAQAQTYSVLHTFTSQGDGGMPYAGLTIDAAGNFYGATYFGQGENGEVFKLTRAGSGWALRTLHEFQGGEDGSEADGGATIGPDGALYGTTYQGGGSGCFGIGCGIVYRLTPPATVCRSVSCPWTETVLHRFGLVNGDGTLPIFGSPIFDRAGNLYGTTKGGGSAGRGTVYELTPSSGGWTETVLWNFTGGDDGGQPVNSLIFDGAGNLYGTATEGGANGFGAVFELSPSGSGWSETTLFSFTCSGTGSPVGGLAWDVQGNLYGTTQDGGQFNDGTVFQLTPSAGSWSYTPLLSFRCCGGPTSTPILDSAGNVYVSAVAAGGSGEGMIVKLAQSQGTWTTTVLHEFQFSDGANPYDSVTLDAHGNVYGTTFRGGSDNQGVIFEITP